MVGDVVQFSCEQGYSLQVKVELQFSAPRGLLKFGGFSRFSSCVNTTAVLNGRKVAQSTGIPYFWQYRALLNVHHHCIFYI